MTATRRTPAQIAADDLAKTEAKLEAVEARIQRLRGFGRSLTGGSTTCS